MLQERLCNMFCWPTGIHLSQCSVVCPEKARITLPVLLEERTMPSLLFSPALPATTVPCCYYDPLTILTSAAFSVLSSYCPMTGKELWMRAETQMSFGWQWERSLRHNLCVCVCAYTDSKSSFLIYFQSIIKQTEISWLTPSAIHWF